MKKLFYLLLMLGLTLSLASCEQEKDKTETSPVEKPTEPIEPEIPEEPSSDTLCKTLVVYYSFTNNVHTLVEDLRTQIRTDVIRVEPAEKGLDYAANNYAIGSALIAAIRNNPDDAASYPSIDEVVVDMAKYDTVMIAAPLWWSQMAAPLQTFLFHYRSQMSGKTIGLIVSSASTGISGVEADAKRLVPEGDFLSPNLWIRSSQTSSCHAMLAEWLEQIGYLK